MKFFLVDCDAAQKRMYAIVITHPSSLSSTVITHHQSSSRRIFTPPHPPPRRLTVVVVRIRHALDSTTFPLQKVTPRIKEHDPMDCIRYMYDIYADYARTHKHLFFVAEFDENNKFNRVLHTWETHTSDRHLNGLENFNDH